VSHIGQNGHAGQNGHVGPVGHAGVVDKAPPNDFGFVVDAHTHMGCFRAFHIPHNDADGMIGAMDALGIDMCVTAAHAGISSDFEWGNNSVMAAADRHPDRILAYCCINPNYPDAVVAEIERCFRHPAVRGIKLHPELHGNYPLDGPAYAPAWEFAEANGVPVLSHSYFAGDPVEVFGRMAGRYPSVPVIVGHAGIDQGVDRAVRLALDHPNVWLDLTGPVAINGLVEVLVERVGADRLLFGTDMPFMNAALQLGSLLYARIPREDMELIIGGNAARIFGIADPALAVGASAAAR
jgi:predicted TIM-barrel fold metal-dependent hydrolase